jgi:hypothetical protein
MKHKLGEWGKPPGGDFGVVWTGRRWETFECVGCAIAKKLVVPVNRLPWTTKLSTLMTTSLRRKIHEIQKEGRFAKPGEAYNHPHDPQVHLQWILAGKLYRKE